MNSKLLLVALIAAFGLFRSVVLAADNRFDGIWVGTETVMGFEFHGTLKSSEKYPHNTSAKIAIAQGGTLLGILEGYGTGRYNDVQRVGNKLVFHAGVRTGELTVSPDGHTLLEKGQVPGFIIFGVGGREGALSGHPTSVQVNQLVQSDKSSAEVTGTFHRVRR